LKEQTLHLGNKSNLSIENHDKYGQVVVKSLVDEYPTPKEISNFLQEYQVGKDLNIDGIRKVYGWEKGKHSYRIYLEYIDGITLAEYKSTKPSLKEFLKVFGNIARCLSDLHLKSIIHNRLSPHNILVKTDTLDVVLIDLASGTTYTQRSSFVGNPLTLNADIHYLAPEQTGRLNRIIDHRSDLYALGIMLYEFIAGHPPFKSLNQFELIHAHIAIKPTPLNAVNANCPETLSHIVDKLLDKDAEKRYQSAKGLQIDLDNCIQQLEKSETIEDFVLASSDVSPRFELSQKLYGREAEIEKLLEVFNKAANGSTQLMLVSGFSGTGKSVLVSEIYKPITAKRGYFIEGKYDQYQRGIPYYAIINAFTSLIHILLTESSTYLITIKEKMLQAVGQEGKVLTDFIPALELLIGKQPDVAEINGEDAQNRFNYIFSRWLSAICSEEHPIVLFIDDLQWADSASLDLMEYILLNKNNYFFCIGAFRDNEVSKAHPLSITINHLKAQNFKIENIHVTNLELSHIEELLSDSLFTPIEGVKDLAKLVHEKTRGNAFFVVQFIKSLAEKNLLKLNSTTGRWNWKIEDIYKLNITDNVVEFMADKIKELPAKTQDIFKVAACLGTRFSSELLRKTTQYSPDEINTHTDKLLEEGLILQLENEFKFTHDRIQQAVYSLIEENDRKILHQNIGELLLTDSSEEEIQEQIFDVVNHLNWGVEFISGTDEKLKLATLNLEASKKAKHNSAFKASFKYISTAKGLLPENSWETHYDLSLEVYEEGAENAFLAGQFEDMHTYIDTILQNATELIAKVKPYEIRVNAYKAENKLKEALETGLEILEQLGEKFPKNPSMLTVFPDLIKTFFYLRNKSQEDILALPEAKDPIKIASIRILANIAPSSYWGNPTIFPHIIFRMVQLAIKHGVTAASAFGFATYGVIMIGVLNKIKTGYPYGKIGLELINRFNAKEWIAQVYTPVFALINIWNGHIKHTLAPLLDSYHIGLETGALEFSCINANIYCIHAYVIGKPLDKLEPEIKDYSHIIHQYKQETNYMYNEVFRQSAQNFMGLAKDNLKLVGDAFNDEKLLEDGIESKNRTISFMIFFHRGILGNYFGDFNYALDNSSKANELLDAVLGKIEVAIQAFHFGLANAYATHENEGKRLKQLSGSIKKMKHWAKHAPENFRHKWYLLLAEKARLKNNTNRARDYFDKSINDALEYEYIQEAALASELASHFHRNNDNANLARYYLRNAYQYYRDWGAVGKLIELSEAYPDELKDLLEEQILDKDILSAGKDLSLASLDLLSIFKVSTALSSEVVFEKMLDKLMGIISENIGANKAALILKEGDALTLRAHWSVQQNEMTVEDIPFDEITFLPKKMIYYIERTKKEVLLGYAWQDQVYRTDEYIKTTKAKSILGMPLLNKGSLLGILYLENTLLENAFNSKNIKVLNLLSNQIAISIENTILYENLEKKVNDRTSELEVEKKKSDDLLLNILPAETALELKKYGKARPRKYDAVTVVFTDFINFTKLSEQLTADELVVEIDKYFTKFDEIAKKYNIEKIKTIGDAYLCVSGLPVVNKNHVFNAINAAIEMRDYVEKIYKSKADDDPTAFRLRIGVHTGPVVSGVVGQNKFAFDIWGDTVNTASRLENNSEAFKINISEEVYNIIKDDYHCEHRGLLYAKNKGDINMYFIERKKIPNEQPV